MGRASASRADRAGRPPRVSVVIPTFNHARFVLDAIRSAEGQTLGGLEIVVVDDGSTDNTAAVVRPLADAGRIRYIGQANAGPSAARNRGVRAARGEFIAFLDADDEWLPQKLERQMALFDGDPTLGVTTTGSASASSGRPRVWSAGFPTGDVFLELLCRGNVFGGGTSCVVARRECLDAVGGFDEAQWVTHDWDLWLRLAMRFRVGWLDEPLTRYRVDPHGASMSGQLGEVEKDTRRLLERLFADPALPQPIQALRPRITCHHLVVIAKSYLKLRRPRDGLRVLRDAGKASLLLTLRSLGQSGKDSARIDSRVADRFARALTGPG